MDNSMKKSEKQQRFSDLFLFNCFIFATLEIIYYLELSHQFYGDESPNQCPTKYR